MLLGLLVLTLLTASFGYFLIRSTPRWYQPVSADDPNVDDYATAAQSRFLEFHNAFARLPLGQQTWSITQDQLNAYLAATYRNPGQNDPQSSSNPLISSPMVILTPDTITLAARSPKVPSHDPAGGVVTLGFKVQTLPPDPSAGRGSMGLITLQSIWIGALPLPPSALRSQSEQLSAALEASVRQAITHNIGHTDAAQYVASATHAIRGEPFPLTYTSGRHRFIITSIRITNGQFLMTIAPDRTTDLR